MCQTTAAIQNKDLKPPSEVFIPFPSLSCMVSFWAAETKPTKVAIATAEIQKSVPFILNLFWLKEFKEIKISSNKNYISFCYPEYTRFVVIRKSNFLSSKIRQKNPLLIFFLKCFQRFFWTSGPLTLSNQIQLKFSDFDLSQVPDGPAKWPLFVLKRCAKGPVRFPVNWRGPIQPWTSSFTANWPKYTLSLPFSLPLSLTLSELTSRMSQKSTAQIWNLHHCLSLPRLSLPSG